jgi:PIN domain nuclease of toxin-antitoxin system
VGDASLIVLDTHTWVWWVNGSRELSKRASQEIDAAIAARSLVASAISCWEIGMLVRRGRLELSIPTEDWISRCEGLPFFSVVPIDTRIALRATELPPRHDDPADRLIVATAMGLGAKLVTKDARLREYGVGTVW